MLPQIRVVCFLKECSLDRKTKSYPDTEIPSHKLSIRDSLSQMLWHFISAMNSKSVEQIKQLITDLDLKQYPELKVGDRM